MQQGRLIMFQRREGSSNGQKREDRFAASAPGGLQGRRSKGVKEIGRLVEGRSCGTVRRHILLFSHCSRI